MTPEPLTRDIPRAELRRALLACGTGIVGANLAIAALTLAAMKLFFF